MEAKAKPGFKKKGSINTMLGLSEDELEFSLKWYTYLI